MKALTELKVADLLKECNTTFEDQWDLIDRAARRLKQRLIEEALEAERTELVCCSYRQRTYRRSDYRNGYWKRWLLLKDGRLELRIPRLRYNSYESQIVPRYVQRMPEVDEALKRVFLFGISTRRTGEALRPLLGEAISAQTVSKIATSLNEEVRSFHTRALNDRYRYLFFDAIILKVKTGAGAKKKAILVAYAITTEGKRELIDFVVTKSESAAAWEGFLMHLAERGLTGEFLSLIATDGNQGLITALDLVYPGIPRQRCWAHKLRNVANNLRKKDRDACIRQAREMYDARNKREGLQAYFRWAKTWRPVAPQAVACIEKDMEELFSFYSAPEALRKKLRTTNVIERAFREVRRRTRPMSCFNNTQSIERIVYAVLSHLNDQWGKRPLKEFTQKV
ncbi:MAG TPA: IS256 family transposase [Syntrophorhabdales bacterium]|nr:IS256 family transposase [Syntrophorhabdales bacterium]